MAKITFRPSRRDTLFDGTNSDENDAVDDSWKKAAKKWNFKTLVLVLFGVFSLMVHHNWQTRRAVAETAMAARVEKLKGEPETSETPSHVSPPPVPSKDYEKTNQSSGEPPPDSYNGEINAVPSKTRPETIQKHSQALNLRIRNKSQAETHEKTASSLNPQQKHAPLDKTNVKSSLYPKRKQYTCAVMLHIPKTGVTILNQKLGKELFEKQLGWKVRNWYDYSKKFGTGLTPLEEFKRAGSMNYLNDRVFHSGHLSPAFLDWMVGSQSSCLKMTMLRDPVDRVASVLRNDGLSREDWIRYLKEANVAERNDEMVRHLSNRGVSKRIPKQTVLKLEHAIELSVRKHIVTTRKHSYRQNKQGVELLLRKNINVTGFEEDVAALLDWNHDREEQPTIDRHDFDAAKWHLDHSADIVCFWERMDACIARVYEAMDMQLPPDGSASNFTQTMVSDSLTEDVKYNIRQQNKWDVDLYEWAKNRHRYL